jgi:hypothetical protein
VVGDAEKAMMNPFFLRVLGGGIIGLLLVAKFFLFGSAQQIGLDEFNKNTLQVLAEISAQPIEEKRQPLRKDVHMFKFSLPDCTAPYFAVQALTMEDLEPVLDAAKPFPEDLNPHVIYLGEELEMSDRIGLKLTAVRKFISYRLGLSIERPSAYLYIILSRQDCTGYRKVQWSRAWASSSAGIN